MALGTGLYTGLGSLEAWRVASNDASFSALAVHDLRVELAEGSTAPAGALANAIANDPVAEDVESAEERLLIPTQVEVLEDGEPVAVPGRIVGVDVTANGPEVDRVAAAEGRALTPADRQQTAVMLEAGFADALGLAAQGTVRIAGERIPYVGTGRSPEQFLLTEGEGGFGLPGSFAVVYAPLAVAQELTNRPDQVNDLVLRIRPNADRERVAEQLRGALAAAFPDLGVRITTTEDIEAHRILYQDAEGDQRLMDIYAFLILAGAGLAALNLISRVVEAQRREIGISMAMGVPRAQIAIRPLLFGLEIALLGLVLGIATGLVVEALLRDVLVDFSVTMPVVATPFQPSVWIQGVLIGLGVVLLATVIPVWRAVRVPPIEAIRVGARAERAAGGVRVLRRLRLPGGSLPQMPVRSLVRAPRRTALSALGLGAVIAVVVTMLGTFDAFVDIIDRSDDAVSGPTSDRTLATLDRPTGPDSPQVRSVATAPGVAEAEPWLRVPAVARTEADDPIDIVLGALPAEPRLWQPEVTSGSFDPGTPGVLLSEAAADDLGVGAGDSLLLSYPTPSGAQFELAEAELTVAGTHPDPLRAFAYVSASQADELGLSGLTNVLNLSPEAGVSPQALARTLAPLDAVASVEPASATSDALREGIEQFTAILVIPVVIGILLALLMAFNSTTINADERTRENATMRAFGLPSGVSVGLSMAESFVIGVLGTAIGIGLGRLLLGWIVNVQFEEVLPEVGARVVLSGATLGWAVLIGVLLVTLAPLLTWRRIRRLDVPSALRVME